MCGFVALFQSRPFAPELLDTMRDRLAHRGPDGAGSWTARYGDNQVGLGHRRLSILDVRHVADQPMVACDGQVVLVFNGEIYNYVELRAELQQHGWRFDTEGDSEVLLKSYLHWGRDCLPKFNGMFAFVLWDARFGCALVARDRFGEKPFYMAPLPEGGLAMASEQKALFCHPSLAARIDYDRLGSFARGGPLIDGINTLFSGVTRFPAASAAWIGPDGSVREQWRYWIPDYEDIDRTTPAADLVEEFRHLLSESVRLRLRTDVDLGACLSGGLDSSALLGLIAQNGKTTKFKKAISARFDNDPTISEGPFIDQVLRHTGVSPESIEPSPTRFMEESLRVHWHQESPFLSASIYNEWCVMRAARRCGIAVMIDGQGADELLGGYQHYFGEFQRDLAERGAWGPLISHTRQFNRRLRQAANAYADVERRFAVNVSIPPSELVRLFAAKAARRALGRSAWSPAPKTGLPSYDKVGRFRYALANALQYVMLPNQLHSADRSAMAFGVESRFPFLDYKLVDWCIRLPDHALIENGWQKAILRKAMTGVVPATVQWRADKVGYAAPLDTWMRGPMKEWSRERLFEGPVVDLPDYSAARLQTAWDDLQQGRDRSWDLWRWISINEWLRLEQEGWWTAPRDSIAIAGDIAPAPARLDVKSAPTDMPAAKDCQAPPPSLCESDSWRNRLRSLFRRNKKKGHGFMSHTLTRQFIIPPINYVLCHINSYLSGLEFDVRAEEYAQSLRFLEGSSSLLDIGCGTGTFLEAWHAAGHPPGKGLEYNPENVAVAVARGLDVEQGDALALPFPDNHFDAIHCSHLMQVFDPDQAHRFIQEAGRVVKDGGVIVITTLNWFPRFFRHPENKRPYPPDAILRYCLRPDGATSPMYAKIPELVQENIWFRRPPLIELVCFSSKIRNNLYSCLNRWLMIHGIRKFWSFDAYTIKLRVKKT